jgi:enoyl-CoA hydratase/carnithine racemase
MTEFVRLEVADGVGTIRLDRPKMNAISLQVQDELTEIAAEATARADVRAVVVWGGERVFAAGNDVKEMEEIPYTAMVDRVDALQGAVTAIARIPKPVVAAINGYALGGGCELAMAADVRFAADDAVLGQPEVLLGIIPVPAAPSACRASSARPRPRS